MSKKTIDAILEREERLHPKPKAKPKAKVDKPTDKPEANDATVTTEPA